MSWPTPTLHPVRAMELTSEEAMTVSQERLAHESGAWLTEEATGAMQSFSRLGDLINAFGSEVRDSLNGAIGLTELIADAILPARWTSCAASATSSVNPLGLLLDQEEPRGRQPAPRPGQHRPRLHRPARYLPVLETLQGQRR